MTTMSVLSKTKGGPFRQSRESSTTLLKPAFPLPKAGELVLDFFLFFLLLLCLHFSPLQSLPRLSSPMSLLIDKPHHEFCDEENSIVPLSYLRVSFHEESKKPGPLFSPPHDLIDFSFPVPTSSNDTYAADELFHHGFLLPINNSQPPPPVNRVEAEKPTVPQFHHRRAGSLNGGAYRPRSETQTYDYQRLRRASSDPSPAPAAGTWQKWHLLVFGSIRFPAEMEMKDIRNRQRRRGLLAMAEDITDNSGRKSRWRILRALSCKAAESSAISPFPATGRFCP